MLYSLRYGVIRSAGIASSPLFPSRCLSTGRHCVATSLKCLPITFGISMGKRKRSSVAAAVSVKNTRVPLPDSTAAVVSATKTQTRRQPKPAKVVADPNSNPNIVDGQEALRASPDSDSSLSEAAEDVIGNGTASHDGPTSKAKRGPATKPAKATTANAAAHREIVDPEADELEGEAVEDIQAAALRPPAVNSDYLPLPWKGRLGYVCHRSTSLAD